MSIPHILARSRIPAFLRRSFSRKKMVARAKALHPAGKGLPQSGAVPAKFNALR